MNRPVFLSVQDVLLIHADTIAAEGGRPELRDHRLLESAVAMPRQQLHGRYLHNSLPAMAAAYLYHLSRNHPFVDGNKRVGLLAALVFLDANGLRVSAPETELEQTVLATADGSLSKSQLILWMRRHCRSARRR